MEFYKNKDNDNYLMINVLKYLRYVLSCGQPNVEEYLLGYNVEEAVYNFNYNIDKEIAILKSSLLGKFLLANVDMVNIIDNDLIITDKKVRDALLIAIYDNKDYKLVNKLESMFRSGVVGVLDEIEKEEKYDRKFLEDIATVEDIDTYILKKEGKYMPKDIIILEDEYIYFGNVVNGDYQYHKKYKSTK